MIRVLTARLPEPYGNAANSSSGDNNESKEAICRFHFSVSWSKEWVPLLSLLIPYFDINS